EPYMVRATLNAVVAQRLVRRLCEHCVGWREPTDAEREILGEVDATRIAEPVGCLHCLSTGYRGRVGLFEGLWVDRAVGEAISSAATAVEIAKAAGQRLQSLRRDGLQKVVEGITTLDEVIQATVEY
ncbi:MAG: hypothetical protein R3236_06795, partial [Phycisphaeraceae bacterium]|nr:hypothetical protein [Phycisphaeraceae bacterium]